jgi:hypothetical protein
MGVHFEIKGLFTNEQQLREGLFLCPDEQQL